MATGRSLPDLFKDPTPDFSLVEKLGEGSYGAVWKGMHKKTGAFFAIKIIKIEGDLSDIRKEVNFMKQIKHPNTIAYYGSYLNALNELWIIMELCTAGSCSDILKVLKRTFNEKQIACVMKDVLSGLDYLHSLRKVHRDIKAGNILLTAKGQAKLADFGVSAQLSSTVSCMNSVIGTPFWMAPEVIQESGYTEKIDIWSLGITAIELAQGSPPHSAIHPMRVIFLIPNLPSPTLEDPKKWSDSFNDFIKNCLIKNPKERPSAQALLQEPFLQGTLDNACLLELVQEYDDTIQREGREKALGMESTVARTGSQSIQTGTQVPNTQNTSSGPDEEEPQLSPSSTMVVKPDTPPEPQTVRSVDEMMALINGTAEEPAEGDNEEEGGGTVCIKKSEPAPSPSRTKLEAEISTLEHNLETKQEQLEKIKKEIASIDSEIATLSTKPPTPDLSSQLTALQSCYFCSRSLSTKLGGTIYGWNCCLTGVFDITAVTSEATKAHLTAEEFVPWVATKLKAEHKKDDTKTKS